MALIATPLDAIIISPLLSAPEKHASSRTIVDFVGFSESLENIGDKVKVEIIKIGEKGIDLKLLEKMD